MPDLDDLLVDNPAVNQPHVAAAVLHVFDSEPDPLRLHQVLFEQLTKLSATPVSSYTNEAMPSVATTADKLASSSGSSAIPAAVPPVAHGTDSPVGTPLEPAQGVVAAKDDSSTAHTVVAPSKKSAKDSRPPAAPQPYNPFLAAMSALNAQEAKHGGQKHSRKKSNENEEEKGRPTNERQADSESPTPNAPRQRQSLGRSGPSAQDAQAVASLSEAASPVEETIARVDGHLAVTSINELARSSPERKRSLDLVSPDIALPSPKQSRYAAPAASSAGTAILDGHDHHAGGQCVEGLGSMALTPGGGPSAGHRDPRVASTSLPPEEQPAAAGPSSWRGPSEVRHSYASDPTDSNRQEWQSLEVSYPADENAYELYTCTDVCFFRSTAVLARQYLPFRPRPVPARVRFVRLCVLPARKPKQSTAIQHIGIEEGRWFDRGGREMAPQQELSPGSGHIYALVNVPARIRESGYVGCLAEAHRLGMSCADALFRVLADAVLDVYSPRLPFHGSWHFPESRIGQACPPTRSRRDSSTWRSGLHHRKLRSPTGSNCGGLCATRTTTAS